MSIERLLTIPCALVERRVLRDELGEPITDDFGNEIVDIVSVVVDADGNPLLCRYEPARRTERDAAGEISEDRGRVWLLPGLDVRHVDAVDVNGVGVLEVVGEPGQWIGPRHPRNDHIELTVERTAGGEDDEGGS